MSCKRDSLGRSVCAQFLKNQFAEIGERDGVGCEMTVSTLPPLVDSGYEQISYTCPHGVVYWVEPTSDQMALWAQKRVP